METARDNGGKVQYNIESSGHVHAKATLSPNQVDCGTGRHPCRKSNTGHSVQTFILLSELPQFSS
jgi:hypothetical protein